MPEPFNPLPPLVTGPLTRDEKRLIEWAVYERWDDDLKRKLVTACLDRSILASNLDTCGELADRLAALEGNQAP